MGPIEVAFWAACLVLVAAGAAKLLEPAPLGQALAALGAPAAWRSHLVVGLVGGAEVLVGVAGLAFGGPLVAGAAALLYVAFACVVLAARRRGVRSCGCFGQRSGPPTPLHAGLDAASAAVCAVAVVRPVGSVVELGLASAGSVLGIGAALGLAVGVVALETR